MKKCFLLILFCILLANPVLADAWDDFDNVDRLWDGQKSITNKEFEEVVDALQANKTKKEEKQKKKKIKKVSGGGNSLHSELSPEKKFTEIPDLKTKSEDGVLVNIPVNLIFENTILEKGYYKVLSKRGEDKKTYLLFYQSQFLKGEVEVSETDDDFGETDVNFAKVIPYNNSFVRLIFGSLDFNAEGFVPFGE